MIAFRKFLPVVAIAAAILGASSQAQAAFKVRISENGGASYTLLVTDNDATNHGTLGGPGDIDPTTGSIIASYSDALVSIVLTHGQSKPLFGNTPSNAAMDINISGTFNLAGSLTIDITDTGFNAPTSPTGPGVLTAHLTGQLTGSPPGSVTGVSLTA